MNNQIEYIHIEGMDLAGKTTATENFKARSGKHWNVRRNSIVENNPIYILADSLRRADAYDAEVLGNLYVAALMADIRSFTWPEENTIQDSTIILRSLAFHSVRGTPRIVEVFEDMLPMYPRFDASFVFTADINTRLKRLRQRMDRQPDQISPEDLLVRDKPEKFMAMEATLVAMATKGFRSRVIDTSKLTPEQVVQSMLDCLPGQKQRK